MSGLPCFDWATIKYRRPMKAIGTAPLVHALAVLTMTLSACNGQAQQHQVSAKEADTLAARIDTPKTEVRVNKEYDTNGNLIAYDSTYSSYYSSHNSDPAQMDSLFSDFRPRFNRRIPFMTDPGFDDLFFRDPLLYPDFFHGDFFRKGMEMNDRWMQRMMAEMDAMKSGYFRDRAPEPPQRGGKPQ